MMDLDTSRPIRVLLVDDDHDDYLLTKAIFSRIKHSPFVLEWTDSFDAARELIEKQQHEIYLIDYLLGEHTGLELLQLSEPEQRVQPFILLTGAGSEEIAWRSIELAASDYLVKGAFDADLLSRTLYYALQRKRAEEQRIQHLLDLNRSKDEFISIASHQLRTPATGVKQYVAMLLEGYAGSLSDQQIALLKKAYESNERQLKIVSDLLKVAQVDAGKVMLHRKPVAVDSLVGDVVRELREIISSQQQTISCETSDEEIVLSIDEASIRMVLENIIDNASKYSQEHTHIQVLVQDAGHSVRIRIVDEGVGIDPEGDGRLFQKFSRLDNTLSTKVSGTGLGLYWARKIIDLHGGTIEYEANADVGTTFTITLPKNDKV